MRDKMKDDANYSEVIDEETTIGDTIVSPLYPLNDNASTLRQKAIDQMPSRKIGKSHTSYLLIVNLHRAQEMIYT